MQSFSIRSVLLYSGVILLVLGFSMDVSGQKKRKKKTQPLPMPTPVQTVTTGEPAVVGRATDYADLEDYLPKATSTPTTDGSLAAPETVTTNVTGGQTGQGSTVDQLAQQVRDLASKIDSMDAKQKLLLDLEILSRAEQRSESLRKQLMDSTEKEGTIKTRLEQIDYDIRPEMIERKVAFAGSLRPEELRENMRKTLESERTRLNQQLTQLQGNRANLEAGIISADMMVEKLRAKLEKAIDDQLQAPAKKPE